MNINACQINRWNTLHWAVTVTFEPDEADRSWRLKVKRFGAKVEVNAALVKAVIVEPEHVEIRLQPLKEDGSFTAERTVHDIVNSDDDRWDSLPAVVRRAHDAFVEELPVLLAEDKRVSDEISRLSVGLLDFHRETFERSFL